MNEQNIKEALLQGGDNIHQLFKDFMREGILISISELMREEVERLCGPKYDPEANSEHRRAGSEGGVIFLGGKRQEIQRPRVREQKKGCPEKEVKLQSYQVARSSRSIEAEVADCVAQGMSSRSFERLGLEGAGRSVVSRRWVERSALKIDELRGRSLREKSFFGLIIDGVFLAKELVVLVCVGLCVDGAKMVLDFEVGSSENYETCLRLLRRLQARGLVFRGVPLAILDGSLALEKGVLELWPQIHIQRCLVHKERNLHSYLRRQDHGECSRLLQRLRRSQGPEAGREALTELHGFLAERNQEALKSLQEAGDKLITLHLLNAPSTLHKSLLSTNLIENVMNNYRRKTARVCRWRPETDQVSRWTAEALLFSEQGFRKILGYEDLPILLSSLGFPPDPLSNPARSAPASCHPPCSPAQAPQPGLAHGAFLPQQEVGDKNAVFNVLHENKPALESSINDFLAHPTTLTTH